MGKARFQNLRIYRLAEQRADEVWDAVQGWPPLARNTVGVQIIGSTDSIGANIAEGAGRGTSRETCRFISLGRRHRRRANSAAG